LIWRPAGLFRKMVGQPDEQAEERTMRTGMTPQCITAGAALLFAGAAAQPQDLVADGLPEAEASTYQPGS
jgi:hypothetical protein